jgi:hypothetical protein
MSFLRLASRKAKSEEVSSCPRLVARESATIFLREVHRWQRRKAKAAGSGKPMTAALSLTQRGRR